MTGSSKPETPEEKEPASLLPKVAGYALAVIVGVLVLALWRALGFPYGSLFDVACAGVVGWLVWDRGNVHDTADTASDDADKAVRKADALENDLLGRELPGHGRHAKSASPAPHPRRTTP